VCAAYSVIKKSESKIIDRKIRMYAFKIYVFKIYVFKIAIADRITAEIKGKCT
jgi:hypothetical protein